MNLKNSRLKKLITMDIDNQFLSIIYFVNFSLIFITLIYMVINGPILFFSNSFILLLTLTLGLFAKPILVIINLFFLKKDFLISNNLIYHDYLMAGLIQSYLYMFFLLGFIISIPKFKYAKLNKTVIRSQVYFSLYSRFLLIIFGVIGILGFYLSFPDLASSFNKNSISRNDLDSYNSGGHWRILIAFFLSVISLSIINIGTQSSRKNWILLLISVFFYFLYAYISDQRGLILMGLITIFAQYHYFVKPIPKKTFFLFFMIAFFLIAVMTTNRINASEMSVEAKILNVITNFLGRNGVEISKTLTIINQTYQNEFLWGSPFIDSVLILVPKILYPEKTTVNFATYIAHTYFDVKSFGSGAVPPGLIAELYVNFWYIGFCFLPFLGWFISKLDLWLIENKFGLFYKILYFNGLYSFGGAILGSSIADTITSVLISLIVLGLSYFLCKKSRKKIVD